MSSLVSGVSIFLLLSTLTNGSPLQQEPRSGTEAFEVPRVRQEIVTDVRSAKRKAFRKMGWPLPAGPIDEHTGLQLSAGTKKESGRVQAVPEIYHAEYLCPVTVGGQKLNIDFDTGSSDFWVFSTYLSQSVIGGHTAYNPNKSSTFKSLRGESFEIEYGDGSGALGLVGQDKVGIGGTTFATQAVELATGVTETFYEDTSNDGLMGFGFSSIGNQVRPNPQKTFFENIQPRLKLPLFSVNLKEDGSGTYQFGLIPQAAYNGSLTHLAVNTSMGVWQVPCTTFTIDGKKVTNPNAPPAVLDTGTSLLIIDDTIVQQYWAQVPQAQYDMDYEGYVTPCLQTLPDFEVGLGPGNHMVTIPGHFLHFAQIDATWCYGGLQSNEGVPYQILGDILFRNAFLVFHGATTPGGPSVSIAKKAS
ncbi:MAG: hypothetical protein M1828_004266 [Chrysothrix sp. TS-e1954]|nr:MAG: hypothetical protein M1828_004266 [Chrysothrix sp. TS-e1954]